LKGSGIATFSATDDWQRAAPVGRSLEWQNNEIKGILTQESSYEQKNKI